VAVVTTYSGLIQTIQDWMSRDDLAAMAPNYVQNFEERFYRQPKNYGPWMESAYSTAMSSGVSAVPASFLGWKVVTLSTTPARKLRPVSLAQLYDEFPRGGGRSIPSLIARNGSNFEYGPFPSSDFTVSGSYYAKPTALRSAASDAVAHYLILNAPDLLLYGSLIEAETHRVRDERVALWQAKYAEALGDYRDLQGSQNLSGGPLQVRVG